MTVFIRDDKRIFFAHVPKTGGTYIEDLFVKNGYRKTFWCADPKKRGLKTSYQHFERTLYEACIDFSLVEKSFISVRHPLDRVMSEFRNSGRRFDLSTWLQRKKKQLAIDPYHLDNHLRPQVDFLRPEMDVFKQEDGFDDKWARRINKEYDLGFTIFEVPKRRNTLSRATTLNTDEVELLMKFCREIYSGDYKVFGYKEDAAKAL